MRWLSILVLTLLSSAPALAQAPVAYTVRVEDPGSRLYLVEAEVPATGEETLVSLPAWTPGHYTIGNYATWVADFEATDVEGSPLDWDKLDADTWRIRSDGADRVRIAFSFEADRPGLSSSLLLDDFGFFNGTNLFPYPETGLDFASTLSFELPAGWGIATELSETGEPGVYRASDYHELVDNPTFVGHFGIDSVKAGDTWIRLAVYPAEKIDAGIGRTGLETLEALASHLHDFFGGVPYDRYTTLLYLADGDLGSFGGLEHAESHLDILPLEATENPGLMPLFQYLLSHEYFHAWNVKRIRPAAMWPYAYDRPQYTPLLWVSEGITDYYSNLVLVRAGVQPEPTLWQSVANAIGNVESVPPAAVEDTSVDTWIDPVGIPGNYYYDKGKALGLLLDALIRDATDGEKGFDDVLLRLWRDHYLEGEGFDTDDILTYIAEHLGEERTEAFYHRYIDGREPLPYEETLALIGLAYAERTDHVPFLGVATVPVEQGEGVVVQSVTPGSSADEAGLQEGDLLLSVGAVETSGPAWGEAFRQTYAGAAGETLAVTFRRDGEEMTGETAVDTRERKRIEVAPDPEAGERAKRLREGLVAG